jgi:hypothetical protein
LHPHKRRSGDHVPQAELDLEAAALAANSSGDQELSFDLPPIGKARIALKAVDPLDIGGRIDRREEAGAL